MEKLLSIYYESIPAFLQEVAATQIVQRIRDVGMNCGCEYTSFPRFVKVSDPSQKLSANMGIREPYSRYDHSLGVALIVWHFTQDKAQAIAGLLHDIATPTFAHSVDFLHGDYLKQESTESGTEEMIKGSGELCAILRTHGIAADEVTDYHRYPIADNESPRLSADRLEYTLGNGVNYGFCTVEEAKRMYCDLIADSNEDGIDELCFRHKDVAEEFGLMALNCSRVYVSAEDRYAMQILSEVLREAIQSGELMESDLFTTETQVIRKLAARPLWQEFRKLHRLERSEEPTDRHGWRQIHAKKRCIDPLIAGEGRLHSVSKEFSDELRGFLSESQNEWIRGVS